MTPSSRSSRATWAETFDCTVNRALAAAENDAVVGDGDEGGELAEVHRQKRYVAIGHTCLKDALVHVHTFTKQIEAETPPKIPHR